MCVFVCLYVCVCVSLFVCVYVCAILSTCTLSYNYHIISGNIKDQSITISESGEQLLAWVPHLIDGSYRITSINLMALSALSSPLVGFLDGFLSPSPLLMRSDEERKSMVKRID